MFTGLVQAVGRLVSTRTLPGGAKELAVELGRLKIEPEIGASIAINGVCQTVTQYRNGVATFCAVEETVQRSTLGRLVTGEMVNLEPALRVGDSIDGHLVLGHVDAVGRVAQIKPVGTAQYWHFTMPEGLKAMFAEKGSITIDGISLTIAAVFADTFSVSLIPLTVSSTRLQYLQVGREVNLEVDVLARYIDRQLSVLGGGTATAAQAGGSGIDQNFLTENGFI